MVIQKVVDATTYTSGHNGAQLATTIDIPINALGAKSISLYTQVFEVSATTNIEIAWQHSPDGRQWVDGSGNLYSATTETTGVHVSSATTDVTRISMIRLIVKVAEATPDEFVRVTMSIWAVLKPFCPSTGVESARTDATYPERRWGWIGRSPAGPTQPSRFEPPMVASGSRSRNDRRRRGPAWTCSPVRSSWMGPAPGLRSFQATSPSAILRRAASPSVSRGNPGCCSSVQPRVRPARSAQ